MGDRETKVREVVGTILAIVTVALCFAPRAPAQASTGVAAVCPAELAGAWTAELDLETLFGLDVDVREVAGRARAVDLVAHIETAFGTEEASIWRDGERLRFQPADLPVAFDLRRSETADALNGFVRFAGHLFHVVLPRGSDDTWSTRWSPIGFDGGARRLDLYFDEEGGGATGGYFFFRDPRLPSLFGEGVVCDGDRLSVRERNLGLEFTGEVADAHTDTLPLVVTALAGAAPVTFRRMAEDEVPGTPDAPLAPPRVEPEPAPAAADQAPERTGDGWPTARPSEEGLDPERLAALIDAVSREELTNVHSVVVARRGRLVVDEYFYGYDRDTPHDLRSASKTLASTLAGLAVRDGHLAGDTARVLPLLPYREYANWDPRKAEISVRDLMTMSSGLDADDSDRNSAAAEGAYQWQTRNPDWVKVALDAPMIAPPGAQPLYGSANPMILGAVLSAVLDEPLEWFAHDQLLAPLGITDYRWFTVPTGAPYLGGGVHMRPRDLLKIGQLYLDGGTWRGERILPESWVRASWGRYGRLAPLDANGHQYGYFWWHHRYAADGGQGEAGSAESLEARGYGGQYLFVVPELELVAVVTAGNYRNGRTRQSEEILGDYILPAVR